MKNPHLIIFLTLIVLPGCQQKNEARSYAGAVEVECRSANPGRPEVLDFCGCTFIMLNDFILQNPELKQATDLAFERAERNASPARVLEFVTRDTKDRLLKEESYIRGTYCAHKKP